MRITNHLCNCVEPPKELLEYLSEKYSVDVIGSYQIEGQDSDSWTEYEIERNTISYLSHLKHTLLKICHRAHKHQNICPKCHSDQFGFQKIQRGDPTLSDDVFELWICRNCNYQPYTQISGLI